MPLSLAARCGWTTAISTSTYHIRRSALPTPGTDDQLYELVSRLSSRPLDRTRPLWEMYLVEGLSDNRVAVYTKSHSSLVDGETSLEIAHVILDRRRRRGQSPTTSGIPTATPSESGLMAGALAEMAARPGERAGRRCG